MYDVSPCWSWNRANSVDEPIDKKSAEYFSILDGALSFWVVRTKSQILLKVINQVF